jgi:hypothetical protein
MTNAALVKRIGYYIIVEEIVLYKMNFIGSTFTPFRRDWILKEI